MSVIGKWQEQRIRRVFERIGPDCRFVGTLPEVKGHVEVGMGCALGGNLVLRTHRHGLIRIGDDCELGDYALLMANQLIELGANTYVAPFAVLRDTNHIFQGTETHWRRTPHITEPIVVGANCYIGERSYLMPGVQVADGTVLAPGSVLTKSTQPNEIWAGFPARRVAHRTDPSQTSKLHRHIDLVAMFGVRPPEDQEQPHED